MERYESLRQQEYGHTRVYDENLLERVGMDEELPLILWTIYWRKLYDEPHLGSRLLTLEFLMTFDTIQKSRKSFVMFRLFGRSFNYDFTRFTELLDFYRSCLPKSAAMRNFDRMVFSDAISGESARHRFSDIHNPSLRFLHRWMTFMLFPMAKLHFVIAAELKSLFAIVNRIKYSPVADIVDYFQNIPKISGPIECTSLVTQIALNLWHPEKFNMVYIEGDVPVLGLDHFVHVHILHEEPDHSISMLYHHKVIRLRNPTLALYSCESLTLQFDRMREAHHSFTGPLRTHG
jgi:hypothetical protein